MPVRFNATYYYSKYKNIQTSTGDFNPDTGVAGAQVMAAAATVQGFEAEATLRPTHWLELSGSLSHTHGNYTRYSYPALSPVVACNGLVGIGGMADASCNAMQFITPWIYNIGSTVTLPLPERYGELSLHAGFSHRSAQPTQSQLLPGQNPGSILEAHGLLNLSASWTNVGNSNVDLNLFMTNVTNKLYRISNTNLYPSTLVQSTIYGEPRMFGASIRYHFGR